MTFPSRSRLAIPLLAVAIVAAACSGSASAPTAGPTMTPTGTPTTAPATTAPSLEPGATPAPTPDATADPAAAARAALESRPWATATLTDVATGQPFRIADFAGKTIFVESMAIWCSNCRAQQARFQEALAQLDPAEVAYVVLTIEPSETGEALAAYKAQQGFEGAYAVAGRDVSAALVAEFGSTAINPPTVPVVIVRPDGTVEFRTGPKSAEDIVATVRG